jgi:UDP-N-acetylmuramoyl-L-alanyl-D-glutamate--2,6-diaminopimelate ligase
MTTKELLYGLQGLRFSGEDAKQDISGLYLDSRLVKKNGLFCAMKGTLTDGHNYIMQAISNGAVAILCEQLPSELVDGILYIVSTDIKTHLGQIAATFYHQPSKQTKVVAVTGTNGKTSIATWLYNLVRSMGYPAGLLSTIRILINGKDFPSTHTTPDVITINSYIAQMAAAGCEFVFMEASSHALHQGRTKGISFAGGIFTNITRDHLDYHGDFKSYIAAKKILFDDLPTDSFALINDDDRNGKVMLQNCQASKYTYSLARPADYHCKVIEYHPDGMLLRMKQAEVWVGVMGQYNAQNLAAVFGTAELLGLNTDEILAGISTLKPVEGRLEIIPLGRKITGIVDYAHTPDALINVLNSLNDVKEKSARIITVVGAGGDRDPGKRPNMARAALDGSQQLILTSDNPRTEDPEKILNDMEKGIAKEEQSRVLRISDRRAAIKTAVALAQQGDIILVAGKGHETYQEIKGVKYPFDDREELKNLIFKD